MPVYPVPSHNQPLQVGPYSRPVGPVAEPPSGEDHNTTGVLYLGAVVHAPTVTKDVSVTGRLLAGAALLATVTSTKNSTGLLPVGVLPRPGTAYPFPASISGNKILDQNGNVFLLKTMSSWSMPSHLSDADIATAVGIADTLGFNGITCWMGGTEDRGGSGWDKYTNLASQNFWSGTPWAMNSGTTLGAAWASVDKVVQEADARGIIVSFSFCSGFSTFGPGPDWDAVTNADMTKVGEAIASRYAAYDNIVWHVMFDDNPSGTRISRVNALFTGINNIEGTSRRPVRWTEVDNGFTTFDRSLYDPSGSSNASRFSVNCIYDYSGDSAVAMENARTEITTGVIGDCEPRYVDNTYTTGVNAQQLRERNYTVFIEGGALINWGHECWWPFGAAPLIGACTDWENSVDSDAETIQATYAWAFVDTYCRDATFEATSSFVVSGESTGDAKAAQGASNTVALCYTPTNRALTVDTTILSGTGNVRIRWFDPTANTFPITVTASEAQNASRLVSNPGTNGAGETDWILVVDLATDPSVTGHVSIGVDAYATVTKAIDVAARLSIGIQPLASTTHVADVAAHLPIGVQPLATTAHAADVAALLPVGIQPLATTVHVADGASNLPIGIEPVSSANKAADGASTLPVGISAQATVAHDADVAALLPIGVSQRATVTGDRTITEITLPFGVTIRAVTDSSTEINTSGYLGLGLVQMATVSREAATVGLLSIGVSPTALVTHDVSTTGRLSIGVVIRLTPQGGGVNICFEVGAPVIVDRAAVLAMVARIVGAPTMVERSAGAPSMTLREAALEMVDRATGQPVFVDRDPGLEMVDRTATVEMVDRDPGDPKISCEE